MQGQAADPKGRLSALIVLALIPTVAALAPSPATSWATLSGLLSHAGTAGTPGVVGSSASTAPLLAVLALAAWACSAWLLVVVVTTWGGQLPGFAGRLGRRTAELVAPASVRTLVRMALGATVAATVLGGPTAAFADSRPPAAGSYEWPGATAAPSVLHRPAATPTAPAARPRPVPVPVPAPVLVPVHPAHPAHPAIRPVSHLLPAPAGTHQVAVVVQPGDSLWAIAARGLGPRSPDAQVAQAWPQWWRANRTVLGDDPDLIHPGTRLTAPSSTPTHP